MKVQQYRKKPIIVEAIQFNIDNTEFIKSWLKENYINYSEGFRDETVLVEILINTLEGPMIASYGDYIIKGIHGEFYPCKPDIFKKTYDLVKEE
ncbi:MAG: hypothetical protein WC942_12015 [Clostridia bacterium]|jgi:hypothetical protein